ncbi:MAG: C40 family peptidase [Magnetococcales bacterium]|nr:C40 family peptidase [Magnetococcales bacterium]
MSNRPCTTPKAHLEQHNQAFRGQRERDFALRVENVLAKHQEIINRESIDFVERLVQEGRIDLRDMPGFVTCLAIVDSLPMTAYTEEDGTTTRIAKVDLLKKHIAQRPIQHWTPPSGQLADMCAKLRRQLQDQSYNLYSEELAKWCPIKYGEPANNRGPGVCQAGNGQKPGAHGQPQGCDALGRYVGPDGTAGSHNSKTKKHTVPITPEEVDKFIGKLKEWIGTPYEKWGGNSKKGEGADCSGSIYKGILEADLPLTYSPSNLFDKNPNWVEVQHGNNIQMDQLQKGDVIQMKPIKGGVWHVVTYDPGANPDDSRDNILHASSGKGEFTPANLGDVVKSGMTITGVFRYHR